MAVCIVTVAAAAQLALYIPAMYKVRLAEPWVQFRPPQLELIERLALTGTLDDGAMAIGQAQASTRSTAGGGRGKRIASARDLEETQTGLARSEALAAGIEGLGTRRRTSSNAVVGLSDGVPMVVVASSFLRTPSMIELRPVLNPAGPGVLNWLCGRQLDLAGAVAVAPREPAVPIEFLPSACRGHT